MSGVFDLALRLTLAGGRPRSAAALVRAHARPAARRPRPGRARGAALAGALGAACSPSPAGRSLFHWPFSDNHDYLSALWFLAVAARSASRDPPGALAHQARRLLGLTFLFATLWKLALSPDFVDGRFFRVTLLTDARFENLAVLAGGMSWEDWERNDDALDELLTAQTPAEESGLVEPPELRRLATLLTLFTGAIEAAIAAAFLWRPGGRLARARDALLLVFAATTFSFATVRGFGWLLMCLGIAQCEPERRADPRRLPRASSP